MLPHQPRDLFRWLIFNLRHLPSPMSNKSTLPLSTESVRPFLPAKDFELSKRFYETLGFVRETDGEVAIFRIGESSFILQRYFQKDWAANFMMQLMVDDLDAWWAHLVALELPQKFGVPAPKAPALQPWGLRISYLVDPSGVLWHVAQRRPDVPHDR